MIALVLAAKLIRGPWRVQGGRSVAFVFSDSEFGKMKCLQEMKTFCVKKESVGFEINELGKLIELDETRIYPDLRAESHVDLCWQKHTRTQAVQANGHKRKTEEKQSSTHTGTSVSSMEEPLVDKRGEQSLVVIEVKKQLYLAGPLIVGSLLQDVVQMISVMFVGHLGELALSSASIATSFAGVTGFSLLSGMSSSLDTLCGQAFGAKQNHLLGIYKQRAILVLTPLSAVVAVIWGYTGQILLLFGQDPEIAMEAGSYIRWMIPSLFVYGPLQCHVRFLQTQNMVLPVMLSSGVTALNHILVCWLLVYKLGLGNKGAALANTISYLTNVSILALYIRLSPSCKSTWTGLSTEAFRDILGFLRLAVPSALMVCWEWWSFELLVLVSGFLPNPKLEASVLSISLNTISLVFRVPYGLSAAISTRVSNELGAGRPNAARLATQVIMVLGIVSSVSVAVAIVLVRNLWGYAYSNDKEVVEYISRIMPIIALAFLFDDMQCVLSGIVRGCGFQKIGSYVNLSAYYLVGIPAALCFAFVYHLGGVGLWMGITCALVVQTVLFMSITLRTNWDKEALKARDRVSITSLPLDLAI